MSQIRGMQFFLLLKELLRTEVLEAASLPHHRPAPSADAAGLGLSPGPLWSLPLRPPRLMPCGTASSPARRSSQGVKRNWFASPSPRCKREGAHLR